MSTQPPNVSLFLNDITDSLPCGIQICGCAIKALLYADDIVILAESPVELQAMINALHKYCFMGTVSKHREVECSDFQEALEKACTKRKVKFRVYSARNCQVV